MKRNEIFRAYGTDLQGMTVRLLNHVNAAEMIRTKAAVLHRDPADMRISLKPNLIACTPAEFGATTHPEIVEGVVRYLLDNGLPLPAVTEGSWVGDKTSEAFEYCGYNALAEKYGLILTDMQKEPGTCVSCGDMKLTVCTKALETDFLINLPVLKGHCQTKVTCALKNMKGLIPNSEKRRFHTLGLHKPIAHLNLALKPDLILVDHVCGDPDFEEGGNPLVRNCILLSLDPVLTDAFAAETLGYRPEEIGYIRIAAELGIGSMDLDSLELITLEGECREEIPDTRRLLQVDYAVEAVDSCSACYGILIGALRRLKEEGLLEKLPCRIGIGQGYRGKTGPFGIGNCTRAFERNVPGCPPDEDTIYAGLKEWIAEETKPCS